jgi:hypothetical protein
MPMNAPDPRPATHFVQSLDRVFFMKDLVNEMNSRRLNARQMAQELGVFPKTMHWHLRKGGYIVMFPHQPDRTHVIHYTQLPEGTVIEW